MAWWPRRRHSTSLAQLVTDGFVALDLETTGLDTRRDAVVSLAAIPFVARQPQPGLRTLVNPGRPIPAASTRIHGLDDAAVATGPPIARVLPELATARAHRVLVGHAIDFDLAVLTRDARAAALPPLRNPALDTRDLALALDRHRREVTLESLAQELGVPVIDRYTAAGDALTAGMILLGQLLEFEAQGVRTLAELLRLQRDAAGGSDRNRSLRPMTETQAADPTSSTTIGCAIGHRLTASRGGRSG